MTDKIFIDVIGWAGSFCVVLAYGLLSTHKVNAGSKFYQLLNIIGSICLIVNTVYYTSYPSTFINIVWFIIALFALINIFKSKNGTNSGKK